MTFPGTSNATSTVVFAYTMPLVVVDHARVESAMVLATIGTAAVSVSFVALSALRTQAVATIAAMDAATAVMRGLIKSSLGVNNDIIPNSVNSARKKHLAGHS